MNERSRHFPTRQKNREGRRFGRLDLPSVKHSLASAIVAALGIAPGVKAAANTIEISGRTDTTVDVSGSFTDIRTNTIRGNSGFNSFNHFQIAAGNTVNLHLPAETRNLINLVHDTQAVINGSLNGLMDGKIGGHIVFADPHGIVVGGQGVLNVGSVMFATPTSDFMDELISADGVIGDEAVSDLLGGNAPQSATGIISIEGTINSASTIAIYGTDVAVNGSLRAATDEAREALFEATVNTEGLQVGTDIDVSSGSIAILGSGDVTVNGLVDASAAENRSRGGQVAIAAAGNVTVVSTGAVRADGASTGGDGGFVEVATGANLNLDGALSASGKGGAGNGGKIDLASSQDIAVSASASVSAAGAESGGDGGTITFEALGTNTVDGTAWLDASAGVTGNGGSLETSGKNLTLAGLNADLSGGAGGEDGQFVVGNANVTMESTAYYTNGGDVLINAGDQVTIEAGATINTRRIDNSKEAVGINPASSLAENPAGLADASAADLYTTASEGDSGNVTLQAPHITVKDGAKILTFATDGFNAGDINLVSGDNLTCNICESQNPGEYFTSVGNVTNSVRFAQTADVSINVENGALLDARYVERVGYTGAAGEAGNIKLEARASDVKFAGVSSANADVKVNGVLRGADIDVSAIAIGEVDFGWLSSLDPADPTSALTVAEEIADIESEDIQDNALESFDDPLDITNLLALGFPVTTAIVNSNAVVEIGDGALLDASGNVNVTADAQRKAIGGTGGLATASLPPFGVGVIYGEVSGTSAARISGNAEVNAADLAVVAKSRNTLELASEAEIERARRGNAGNTVGAFSLAIGVAATDTEATVGKDVQLAAENVEVRASNLDTFITEASSSAGSTATNAPSQGALTLAISAWNTNAHAAFNASMADDAGLSSLDVVADNLSDARVTKAEVQNGFNAIDYLVGSRRQRSQGINAFVQGQVSRTGQPADLRVAAATSLTFSQQSARAEIGEGVSLNADGNVSVRSRVVNQGVRSIADSRANSLSEKDGAQFTGSVAFTYGDYLHSSQAIIGDGADIAARNIGVGARSALPIDNDYDEILSTFNPEDWDGPQDFFAAINEVAQLYFDPDVAALENFGLADNLLTSYANAYANSIAQTGETSTAAYGSFNGTFASHDTKAWVGEGAKLTTTGADEDWSSEFVVPFDPPEGEDDHDLSFVDDWNWAGGVDVDARSFSETAGVTGNVSFLTWITARNSPTGNSLGGSVGWTEFDSSTIAGIGDGAHITTTDLNVNADTTELMYVVAPSAGSGESIAGNGIVSYANVNATTRASIHQGARVEASAVNLGADYNVNLWTIGGAVAIAPPSTDGTSSSKTAVGVAFAYNDVHSDTRAYIGDNSADRALDEGEEAGSTPADVPVAGGETAGLVVDDLNVDATSRGTVGVIAAAGAAAVNTPASGTPPPPTPSPSPTATQAQNGSFTAALSEAGRAFGAVAGGQPGSSIAGAGSVTLNMAQMDTIAEVRDTALISGQDNAASNVNVRAIGDVDQISAAGAAAIAIAGGSGSAAAVAASAAFNDIDNEVRAGLYGVDGQVNLLDILAAGSGDILSIGLAMSATSSSSSGASGAGSLSVAAIESDFDAEVEGSNLQGQGDGSSVNITGYDRSRILTGGGSLALNLGSGSGGSVGLATTYGRIDNDVSAMIRGSSLTGFDGVGVSALGAARILGGAFGGSVATGSSFAGAGSVYILTVDSDLQAGITGLYGTQDHDGDAETPELPDYANLLAASAVESAGDVRVTARSDAGTTVPEDLFRMDTAGAADDFNGSALLGVGEEQPDLGLDAEGLASGEVVLGFAGSFGVSGGNAAAGASIGFTDLRGSYVAEIRDADVTATDGDVDVSARNSRQAIGVAAGASVSGGNGVSAMGSGAITLSSTEVAARVLGQSALDADNVSVSAAADGNFFSLAGSVAVSAGGQAAVGASASYNEIGGIVSAELGGNTVITDGGALSDKGTVSVTADQDADIASIAVAGSVAANQEGVALAGSSSVNIMTLGTSALINAGQMTAGDVAARVRTGTEDNRASIWSLAGAVTASGAAGVGLASATNTITGAYEAGVEGTEFLETDTLAVNTSGFSEIKTLGASAGGAAGLSLGISNANSFIDNSVSARVEGVRLSNDAAEVAVTAADNSSIDSIAAGIQGGATAIGASVAVNRIGNDIDAAVRGGQFNVADLQVQAQSDARIGTVSAGLSAGSTDGLSGSVSVNLLNTNTLAEIAEGAQVVAQNNVGVLAGNKDTLEVFAGAVGVSSGNFGGGASLVVNHMLANTEALIAGPDTSVSALALGNPSGLEVADGRLAEQPELLALEELADLTATDLNGSSREVRGVAVNAQSLQSVSTLAVTGGFSAGTAAGAATGTTNIVGGSTRAGVSGAAINAETGADAAQEFDVRASSHAYTSNMGLGIAGSGGGAGTGVLVTDIVNRQTEAFLRDVEASAAGDVTVDAYTGIGSTVLSAGAAGGAGGVAAGSGTFALHDASTLAYMDSGTSVTAGGLRVNAESDNQLLLAAGAVSGAGTVAVAGAMNLAVSSLTTEATIDGGARDGSGAGERSEIDVSGETQVKARTDSKIDTVAVGASGAGAVGVAGSVAATVGENRTIARVRDTDVGNAGTIGAIRVAAEDNIDVNSLAGALGVGASAAGVGVGAGGTVSVVHSTVAASVENSRLETTGDVAVDALSNTTVDSVSVAAGAGGTVGISGALSVTFIGNGDRGDANQELNKDDAGTLNELNALANADRDGAASEFLAAGESEAISANASYNVYAGTDAALADTTTARVDDSAIRARDVSVTATDKTGILTTAGAAGAGGIGAGGAVVIDRAFNTVIAEVTGASTLDLRGNLAVEAHALASDDYDHAVWSTAVAGGAGLVGLGASVVDSRIDNLVQAGVSGTVSRSAGGAANTTVAVEAEDATSVEVDAIGAAAGAAAVGVVVATGSKQSDVDARIENGTFNDRFGTRVEALSSGTVDVHAMAAAGGLAAAGSGAISTALDSTGVHAGVYNSNLQVQGAGLDVIAGATTDTTAYSQGVNFAGGLAIGASIANAQTSADVGATVDGDSAVGGIGGVSVNASVDKTSSSANSAEAIAEGSAGGIGVGNSATEANAVGSSDVVAVLDATVSVQGNVDVSAENTSGQYAKADGFAVGLAGSIGTNKASATADGTTTARFGGALDFPVRTNLTILADSETRNRIDAEAGSGGLIAGASTTANTSDTSTTVAELANQGLATLNRLAINASHTSDFNAQVSTVQASALGASGGTSFHDVDATAEVVVADGARVDARNIDIDSRAEAKKTGEGYNLTTGAGGIANAAAATVTTNVTLNSLVNIGSNAALDVTGDWRAPGEFQVDAETVFDIDDRLLIDAGGALPNGRGEAYATLISVADVSVGEGAHLTSVGELAMGARTDARADIGVSVKTYGVSGAASGLTDLGMTADNTVTIGSGAFLKGYGDVTLNAGMSSEGTDGRFELTGRTDLWNNTAIAMNNPPVAMTDLENRSRVTIESGSMVEGVRDIILNARPGRQDLVGRGTGTDLATQAVEGIINGISDLVDGEQISLQTVTGVTESTSDEVVSVNGTLRAGVHNHERLDLGYTIEDDKIVIVENERTNGINYRIVEGSYNQTIQDRIDELTAMQAEYAASPTERAAFQSEINLLREALADFYVEELGYDRNTIFNNGRLIAPQDLPIQIVEVDPVIARGGNIKVTGDALVGSGSLNAPGDATIEIQNSSPAFLRLNGLEIPNDATGDITFNDSLVENNADLASLNTGDHGSAAFGQFISGANSDAPSITVNNTFNPSDVDLPDTSETGNALFSGLLPTDIFVQGDILNLGGSIELESSQGSLYIQGDIRGDSLDIGAGANILLSYVDSFRHVGNDPRGADFNAAGYDPGTFIAGNNLVASARYLNINGTIQSGIADWSVVIDEAAMDLIDSNRPANPVAGEWLRITDSDPSEGIIGFRYDYANERIVLDEVDVAGGYMELTGEIMSTGGGEIRVIDGYGRVNIQNTTGRDLRLADISLGNDIEGVLRINDTDLEGGETVVNSTIYTRLGDDVQIYKGKYDQIARTEAFLNETLSNTRQASYSPSEGLDYVWLEGQKTSQKRVITKYWDTIIGFIDGGEATSTTIGDWVDQGSATPMDGAEYVGFNVAELDGEPFETGDNPIASDRRTWTECVTRVLVCLTERYYEEYTETKGGFSISRNVIDADHDIAITFSGYDSGSLSVSTNSDLTLAGELNNADGVTRLVASNGSINAVSSDVVIDADRLELDAFSGIGNEGTLAIDVGAGGLNVITAIGDVNLDAIRGDLLVDRVDSNNDVLLSAQGNLVGLGPDSLVRGNNLTLTARAGSIGAVGSAFNINSNRTRFRDGTVTAAAQGDITLNETIGDLRVVEIAAGGDVSVSVADGDLVDANTNDVRDERRADELLDVWNNANLLGEGAEASLEQQKEALQNAGQARYERYWQLRLSRDEAGNLVVTEYDPDYRYTLDSSERDFLVNESGWTDTQLADYEASQSQAYHDLHEEFGSAAYDEAFVYEVDADVLTEVADGAIWTESQLRNSVSRALIEKDAGGSVVNEDANIIGRNVTLSAANIGRTVADDVLIDVTDGLDGISEDDLLALASAEFDDVIFDVDNPKLIRVIQREDLDIQASCTITSTAEEDIFLGGETDFNLYNVDGGSVRIATDGAITTARPGQTVVSGSDVVLESATGNIGSAAAPIQTAITGDLSARAANALHLDQQGSLSLGRAFAGDSIWLSVAGGNLVGAFDDTGINVIQGGAVNLNVDGNIGSDTRSLNVLTGAGKALNLQAGGVVWLGVEANDLLIGQAESVGAMTLTASTIQGDGPDHRFTSGGPLSLTAVGDIGSVDERLNIASAEPSVLSRTGSLYLSFLNTVTGGGMASLEGIIRFDSLADVTLDSVLASDGDIVGNFGGNGALGTVETGTFLDLASDGHLAVNSANAGTAINLIAVGNVTVGEATSETDLVVNAGQTAELHRVESVNGNIIIDAADATVEFANADSADAEIRIHTSGTQAHGQKDPAAEGYLSADGRVELVSGGDIRFRQALAGKDIDTVDLGGDIFLESANGNITGNLVRASRDVITRALRGELFLERIDVGRGHTISAGRDINVALGGSFDSRQGSIEAGRNISLTTLGVDGSAGDILLGGLLAREGTVNLDAAGDIRVEAYDGESGATSGRIDAGQDIIAKAGGSITLGNGLSAGADIVLDAADELDISGAIQAGNDLDAAAGRGLSIADSMVVGGSATLIAGKSLEVAGGVTVGGQMNASAGGNLLLAETVDVAGDLMAEAGDSISMLNVVSAGADVSLRAVDTILVDVIESMGDQTLSAGEDVDFSQLRAGGAVSVAAGNRITGGTIFVPGEVNLAGSVIDTAISHSGQNLTGRVTGYDGGLAGLVALDIDSAGSIGLTQMHAEQASVTTNTSAFAIDSGWIGTELSVLTGTNTLYMNNRDASIRDVDVQLFEPDTRFSLQMRDGWTWTDAYVSHYRPGHDVQSPNYNAERDYTGIVYSGASVARDNDRFMQGGVDAVTRDLMQALDMPLQSAPAVIFETESIDGSAVNLDDIEAANTTESTDDEKDV
jgi:filamentous hemagglutinin family protein